MKPALAITAAAIVVAALIISAFTFNRANNERLTLAADLQYRTRVMSDSLAESLEPSLMNGTGSSVAIVQKIVDRIATNDRVAGLAVFDNVPQIVAYSKSYPSALTQIADITKVLDGDQDVGSFQSVSGKSMYVFIAPLHAGDRVIGALVVVQNADYIDTAVNSIWQGNLIRFLLQFLVYGTAILILVRFVFYRSVTDMVEAVRAVRRGDAENETAEQRTGFLGPLSKEIGKMSSSLRQARHTAREEARMRLEKLDTPWTAERLSEFIRAYLKDRKIFVVSNKEPYVHEKHNKTITWHVPAGGMVTALEPLMEACEGTWIAHGSGSGDKATAGKDGTIRVPPDEPRYTLRRVWLTEKDVKGYYDGFSNEALWPLSHMAHVRPQFRQEDWAAYRKVNATFAKTLLAEIKGVERPVILVQDYQLSLLPALVKKARPDAEVAFFWHIPWPSAVQFSICPWRKELLEGILGADLVGFHTQHYCNNFIDTVATELESRIDYEQFSIHRGTHETRVKPFPISIAFPGNAEAAGEPDRSTLEKLGIGTEYLGLGVERLDYTKGIVERFKGIEFFLTEHPEYRERFTFFQVASPSRGSIPKYREYADTVFAEAKRINESLGTPNWKPIIIEHRHHSHAELKNLYQLADLCLVTSVHDGMNLVAKEYVAAHGDKGGALILSQFAGASRDLKGALITNPYSAEDTAEHISAALTMPIAEQHRRMKLMRNSVKNYNVFRWAAEIIKALTQIG